MKRRWETKWEGLDLTTEKMRKGRRSPETGVGVMTGGFEGAEVGLEAEVELESSEIEGFWPP